MSTGACPPKTKRREKEGKKRGKKNKSERKLEEGKHEQLTATKYKYGGVGKYNLQDRELIE